MRLPMGRGGMSIGGVVALVAVAWLLGIDPMALLGGATGPSVGIDPGATDPAGPLETSPEEEDLVQFVSFVLDDLQTTWPQLLPGYRNARLVLFRDATHSACGTGQSEMGPFYCPADEKVYIDLSFYGDLRARFGAEGDFAQAYVLAHEVGHHVQTLIGTNGAVQRESRENPSDANELSVRLELQADCFAGVWGASVYARGILEPGDVEEALAAAAAVGDDRIQQRTQGRIDPETFTHGTSDQRVRWFRTGFDTGDPEACDTFSGDI